MQGLARYEIVIPLDNSLAKAYGLSPRTGAKAWYTYHLFFQMKLSLDHRPYRPQMANHNTSGKITPTNKIKCSGRCF